MKRECAVVQDLLILYEDDVLKAESREMVEEHIRGCEECMQVYENAGKELPAIEHAPEPSEKEKEAAAVQTMGKLKKRITYKTAGFMLFAVLIMSILILLADNACSRVTDTYWGIAGMLYLMPTEDIEVTNLFILRNGDIYCTLKFDKEIGTSQIAEWNTPAGKEQKDTDDAVKELRFRANAFWELNNAGSQQVSYVFSCQRRGFNYESGETVIQNCKEIAVYGKTKKDKLTIWNTDQEIEEASEAIAEKAIQLYIRDGKIAKAVRLCELMGWDDYEKIFEEEIEGEVWPGQTFIGDQGEKVEFSREGDSSLEYQ